VRVLELLEHERNPALRVLHPHPWDHPSDSLCHPFRERV
jgi:hypothetical protein